jgi:glycosyltransferase involved in cell wall biosynthesis
MARLAFLDRIAWDYRVDTPEQRPLGGSQSALCYLARALARLGHDVRTVTMTRSPARIDGVDCLSGESGYAAFAGADAVIVLNDPDPELALALRRVLSPQALLVLWTQHDVDQPAIAAFADLETRRCWDRIVFVSDWQSRAWRRRFGPEPEGIVLGNAMAPSFETLFAENEPVLALKREPRLIYTSTPFRGLEVLLAAFPLIRASVPEARLSVYSSLAVYQVDEARDGHGDLYRRCRELPGIDYSGQVAQPELARALKGALCFAYPSTFPETFCTSALEAMAAGCLAILGDLGALAETSQGLAELVPVSSDPGDYASAFAERVVPFLIAPEALAERLDRQRRLLLANSTWQARAEAWSRWLDAARRR